MPMMQFAVRLLLTLAIIACLGERIVTAANRVDPPASTMTLQELMQTRIDPAADSLWDSVAFIAAENGIEDRRPRSPMEWAALREHARSLIAASVELELAGRRVSALSAAPGPGELSTVEIQRRINGNSAAFVTHARILQSAARKALAAIDAKDADALMNAGGVIDAACEACHVVYWYPQQLRGLK